MAEMELKTDVDKGDVYDSWSAVNNASVNPASLTGEVAALSAIADLTETAFVWRQRAERAEKRLAHLRGVLTQWYQEDIRNGV